MSVMILVSYPLLSSAKQMPPAYARANAVRANAGPLCLALLDLQSTSGSRHQFSAPVAPCTPLSSTLTPTLFLLSALTPPTPPLPCNPLLSTVPLPPSLPSPLLPPSALGIGTGIRSVDEATSMRSWTHERGSAVLVRVRFRRYSASREESMNSNKRRGPESGLRTLVHRVGLRVV